MWTVVSDAVDEIRTTLSDDSILNRYRQQCGLKAKFHYASWFGAGSEPVRSSFGASSKPASIMEFGFNDVFGLLDEQQQRIGRTTSPRVDAVSSLK